MASWERFYACWKDDSLDVPYMTCLTSDLYEYYVSWCKKNGERSTSSTKFLTFIGLREHKQRIRYRYDVQNGNSLVERSGQSMALIINLHNQNPDQNTYGICISKFKSAIMTAQRQQYDDLSHPSQENSNPFI